MLLKLPYVWRLRLGVLLLLLVAMPGLVPKPAAADAVPVMSVTGGLTVSSPYVVDYKALGYPNYELLNSRRELIQGSAVPGGCQFSLTPAALAPGQPPHDMIELAFDPVACQSIVELGIPRQPHVWSSRPGQVATTGPDGAALSPNSGINLADPRSQTDNCPGGPPAQGYCGGYFQWHNYEPPGSPYHNTSFYNGFQDQWHDEPARWVAGRATYDTFAPVNEIVNSVQWSPDHGSCATPGVGGNQSGSRAFWLTETGWTGFVDNQGSTPSDWTGVCLSSVISQSYAHFHNVAFCAVVGGVFGSQFLPPIWGLIGGSILGSVNPTDVTYWPNEIEGLANGGLQPHLNWSKTGACSNLLATRYSYGYY